MDFFFNTWLLFVLNILKKKLFNLFLILTLLFLICIIITGERSNTIKALIGLSIFIIK